MVGKEEKEDSSERQREVVPEFKQRSPEELCIKVKSLLEDEKLRESLRVRGKVWWAKRRRKIVRRDNGKVY